MNGQFRHIALIMMAAALVGGCSENGGDTPGSDNTTPEQDYTAIAFSGSLSEEGTGNVTRSIAADDRTNSIPRAETPLEGVNGEGITTFYVWGYKNTDVEYNAYQTVMEKYTVIWRNGTAYTTTSNTDGWEYVGVGSAQTIKYWDWSATAYRFFGIAETPTGQGVANTTNGASGITFNIDVSSDAGRAAAPYYSKLWFSNGNPETYPTRLFGQPVKLEFVKPYTKVRFLFKQSEGADELALTDIRFGPDPTDPTKIIATAGTFTITYPLTGDAEETWSVTNGTTSLTNSGNTFIGLTVDNKWYYVLPARASDQGPYTLSVIANGEPETAAVPEQFMEWKPGYEYTYVFKIDKTGITLDIIQVGINNWILRNASEHTVYNW